MPLKKSAQQPHRLNEGFSRIIAAAEGRSLTSNIQTYENIFEAHQVDSMRQHPQLLHTLERHSLEDLEQAPHAPQDLQAQPNPTNHLGWCAGRQGTTSHPCRHAACVQGVAVSCTEGTCAQSNLLCWWRLGRNSYAGGHMLTCPSLSMTSSVFSDCLMTSCSLARSSSCAFPGCWLTAKMSSQTNTLGLSALLPSWRN